MIVIVVGSDKSGKSTLVERLRTNHGWYTSKFSKDDAKILKVLHCINITRQLSQNGLNLVLDRFPYPDDLVYSPIVENKPSELEPYEEYIDIALHNAGTLLIHLFADLDVIAQRYSKLGGDPYLSFSKVVDIVKLYRTLLGGTRMSWTEIDTSYKKPAQVEAEALEFINAMRKDKE